MTQTMSTSSQTFQYLLGKLSESESLAIEEAFFADQAAFDELLIAENDLTDAYVTDRLSAEDRRQFESRLLLSPRHLQRARFAEALMKYSGQHAQELDAARQAYRANWFDRLSGAISLWPTLAALSTAVLLLAAITGIWFWRTGDRPTDQARVEVFNESTRPTQPLANVVPAPTTDDHSSNSTNSITVEPKRSSQRPAQVIATLVLPLNSTRDLAPSSSFSLPRNATRVRLVAQVEDDGRSSYFARLETVDGQQVWHGKSMTGQRGSVIVTIPAKTLKQGDFILTLKKLTLNGTYQEAGQIAFSIRPN